MSNHAARPAKTAPRNAEFLFYLFLDTRNCDAVIGDLQERYRIIRRRFGTRRAEFWYWTQAIRSLGPIAKAWTKKLARRPIIGLIAWAILRGLLRSDSWLARLTDLHRRLGP